MCSECGDLYSRAGYKIIKVPLPGSTPVSAPVIVKKERPVVTQEPAGPSKTFEEEIKPPRPTLVVTDEKLAPKSLKTVCTQTEPRCVSTVSTQTSSFQELRDTWKREYDLSQGKAFQQHKSLWLNHVYRNWEVFEQSRAQHKENKKLKTRLSLIFDLVML